MKKIISILIIFSALGYAQDLKSERQIKLEKSLMAPCCYGGAIYDHESEIAYTMKEEIKAMINAGRTDSEILAYYEKKYGEKILASPKAEGFNLAAWWVPAVIGLLSFLAYLVYAAGMKKRLSHATSADHVSTSPTSDLNTEDIIERELNELKKNY